jgi:hypothetical protein
VNDLDRIDGLYIGQLTPTELDIFHDCVKRGFAVADYSGATGILGIGKVRVLRRTHESTSASSAPNATTD